MANHVVLVGRVGADPTLRHFGDKNTAVANFSVACDEKWRDKDGHQNTKTEWVQCVAWSKLAEIIAKFVASGALVVVHGKLETRKWLKDGVKHYRTQVLVRDIEFHGKRKRNEAGYEPSPEEVAEGIDAAVGPMPDIGDDIPF